MKQYHVCSYHLDWYDCYNTDAKYSKFITPESFAHPAKFSWGLLEHIFKHLQELNLITPNTTVVDFMAGSGRTLTIAELFGYKSIGIELEPHFITMIEGNKAKIEKIMGRKAQMEFMQGDARQLSGLLKERGCVGVVSPPYSNAVSENHGGKDTHPERAGGSAKISLGYSTNEDNIGNLKDIPLVGITSPPYGTMEQNQNIESDHHVFDGRSYRPGAKYSQNPENIGNLPDRQLVGITSPPYDDMMGTKHTDCKSSAKLYEDKGWNTKYSTNPNNIGATTQTYLSAMLQVYSQAFKSGISPLVLVTKNPTRNGKLRDLAGDTIKILEQSGYEIFDYHRAILFKEVTQGTLDGESFTKPKGRLSFFKRLSYDKGNVVARWEDVIFARISNQTLGTLTGITSPPYADQNAEHMKAGNRDIDKFWENAQKKHGRKFTDKSRCVMDETVYSKNPVNIGNLPDKPIPNSNHDNI